MDSNDNHHEEIKTCPFSGQKCITTDCMLWMEISMQKPGMPVAQKQGTCAFVAAVMVGSSPKMMMMPQQGIQGLQGLSGIPGIPRL